MPAAARRGPCGSVHPQRHHSYTDLHTEGRGEAEGPGVGPGSCCIIAADGTVYSGVDAEGYIVKIVAKIARDVGHFLECFLRWN